MSNRNRTMADKKTKKGVKGKADKDSADSNPLLHIEDKKGFRLECGNLLQNNSMLTFPEYDTFDIKKDKEHFDMSKLNRNSSIIITLRYYEYVCVVTFDFEYIIPIMESGLIAKDVFDMMKHCLKNKMMLLAPSWETVFEPDFCYNGYIKY